MRQTDLIPFFTITFVIAWGVLGLYIFASETMVRLFGDLTGQHPLFYVAVYVPAIAALAVIIYRLARTGPAFASASNGAHLGGPRAGNCLGGLAPARVYAQHYTPKRLGVDSFHSGHSLALSVIVTPLFNHSHGSILLPAFFHLQLINPLWPDAQPYDTWLFVVAAAIVVWLNRETMFSRHSAVTDVLPK